MYFTFSKLIICFIPEFFSSHPVSLWCHERYEGYAVHDVSPAGCVTWSTLIFQVFNLIALAIFVQLHTSAATSKIIGLQEYSAGALLGATNQASVRLSSPSSSPSSEVAAAAAAAIAAAAAAATVATAVGAATAETHE